MGAIIQLNNAALNQNSLHVITATMMTVWLSAESGTVVVIAVAGPPIRVSRGVLPRVVR